MSGPFGSSQWMYNAGGGFYDYEINDSLRFEDGSSAYLNRTPASAGNRKTWTWSGWVKRGNLGVLQVPFSFGDNSTGGTDVGAFLRFSAANNLEFEEAHGGVSSFRLLTTQVFRDTSAWGMVTVSVDTTQATASNRIKIYWNGIQITSFSTATYPSQNFDTSASVSGNTQRIGVIDVDGNAAGQYFDGYLSDIYFIDGQALDPTSFGETKDGVWIPKSYSGSYGTNGFRLKFDSDTTDSSGNGNDWTANNISAHDYVPDSPTNNFATWNPLRQGANFTTSEGNLKAVTNATANQTIAGTFGMPSGKWYWEVKNEGGFLSYTGIVDSTHAMSTYIGSSTTGSGYAYDTTGQKVGPTSGTAVAYGATYTAGDIIGVALDMDAGTLEFYKNGVSQGTAFTGITGTWFAATSGNAVAGKGGFANFGQDSTFAGATTAGGNTDANGKGDFKYAPPSGYLALCSANLPEPVVGPLGNSLSDENFNTVLWTGTGSGQSITGMGFQPDWLWFKQRNGTSSHALIDSVRGVNQGIVSNSTAAEVTSGASNDLVSFDSDGFTTGTPQNFGSLGSSGLTIATWGWKAGGTAVSNTDGSITSQVSANTDAGFSVVSWTGNATTGATAGHGLSTKPSMVITKARTYANLWQVNLSSDVTGTAGYLNLDGTGAIATIYPYYYTSMDSSVLTFNGTTFDERYYNNRSGEDYIAYCFADVEGFSKAGSYAGNSSTDGPFVYTGFRPAWILIKKYAGGTASDWHLHDTARDTYNSSNTILLPNTTSAGIVNAAFALDVVSNGFKLRTSDGSTNGSSLSYIYLAFAETPFKYANAR